MATGAMKVAPEPSRFRVGTAGWAIPKAQAGLYPKLGSHLSRYARALNCVEINSSFYRHHQAKTYARWSESVGDDFRFAVKLARAFTHEARLAPAVAELRECLDDIGMLGAKLGVLLIQLPPSLAFDPHVAEAFLSYVAGLCPAPIALEPRHRSWAAPEALALLERYEIAKVIADPDPCPAPQGPRADRRLRYYRLHGSPEIYRSRYTPEFLADLAREMESARSANLWCIFDNTTFGYAHENAHELQERLAGARRRVAS